MLLQKMHEELKTCMVIDSINVRNSENIVKQLVDTGAV